jgi:hypothetical protein
LLSSPISGHKFGATLTGDEPERSGRGAGHGGILTATATARRAQLSFASRFQCRFRDCWRNKKDVKKLFGQLKASFRIRPCHVVAARMGGVIADPTHNGCPLLNIIRDFSGVRHFCDLLAQFCLVAAFQDTRSLDGSPGHHCTRTVTPHRKAHLGLVKVLPQWRRDIPVRRAGLRMRVDFCSGPQDQNPPVTSVANANPPFVTARIFARGILSLSIYSDAQGCFFVTKWAVD